jgi:hypothetical protein
MDTIYRQWRILHRLSRYSQKIDDAAITPKPPDQKTPPD